jgi:hypothetical protein
MGLNVRNRFVAGWTVVATGLLVGCGPTITETRMSNAAAKPSSCQLEFLNLAPNEMGNSGPYETLGFISLSDTGSQDPMQEEYRALVRPRACRMGGEAISLQMQATNTTDRGTGSAVTYAVMRKRQVPTAPPPPSKF